MKFAVIEYSSKSGRIWRHRDDHPNYLANPVTEIDPTSFGCYVSALRGEHIPLKGLIIGLVNQVAPGTRLLRKLQKRLLGRWPQNYPLSYLKSFEAVLIVHQISEGAEVTAFTKRLKHVFPALVVLGVATQPYGLLKAYWEQHADWLKDFQEFLNACDVYISIVKETVPAWQRLGAHKVVYLPQPYPATFARQFWLPAATKEKIIYVAGVTDRPAVTAGMTVAKQLQQEFPEYDIHVTQPDEGPLTLDNLQGSRFRVLPFEQWQAHLKSLRRVRLVINTDYTLTRGRVQTDCAAVGTVSLGANSDAQADLFPEFYASSDTPLPQLVAMGRRLLQDQSYYQHAADVARERLLQYDYDQTAVRLRELVTTLQR